MTASTLVLVLTSVVSFLAVTGNVFLVFSSPDVLNVQNHKTLKRQAIRNFQNKEEKMPTVAVPASRNFELRNVPEMSLLYSSDAKEKNSSPLTSSITSETLNVPRQPPLHSSETDAKVSAFPAQVPQGGRREPFDKKSSDLTKADSMSGYQQPQTAVLKPLIQQFSSAEKDEEIQSVAPIVFNEEQRVGSILDSGLSNTEAAHAKYHGPWYLDTNCTRKIIYGDVACDCSWLGLTGVPKDLPLIINCTRLYLDYNVIRSISSASFLGYSAVKVLNLENNLISKLYPDSFLHLTNVLYLNLRNNSLPMINGTFPKGVFRHFSDSLTYLNIEKNNPYPKNSSLEYPIEALLDLPHLEELYMDGLYNKSFQQGFVDLKNLRLLKMSGYNNGFCRLDIIKKDTFRYLGQLHVLNISSCYVDNYTVDSGAFAPLTNLEVLDISWNDYLHIDGISRILQTWPKCKLTELYMNFIVPRYASNRHISRQNVDTLPPTLKILEVQGNSLATIDPDVFENLPKNLSRLVVGENRFIFGCYLKNMSLMENLEELDLDGGGYVYRLPTVYPSCNELSGPSPVSKPSCEESNSTKLVIHLPPKLKTFSMRSASFVYSVTELHIDSNNTLQNLHLDGNHFPYLDGPIYGLHHLTNLTAEECGIKSIHKDFFLYMNSLRHLDLGNNLLGLYMPANSSLALFEHLTNLRFLNLSFNAFQMIENWPNFFNGLDNLEELLMFNNRLWHFNMNISHMHSLKILNLTDTFLATLNKDVRSHIDNIFPNTSLQADLSHNQIFCTCDNLDFLKWLAQSKAFNKSLYSETYMCVFSGGVYSDIHDGYAEIIKTLTNECISRYVLFLYTCGGTLLCVCFIIVVIVYRFRWNLRYFYYAAYLSLKKKNSERSGEFRYDVFISYTAEDEDFILQSLAPELENRGLKLLIHGRDFLVGDYIASNIFNAVKESKKTLVVLTRALLQSTWCNYEIQMANMESTHTGRQILIFMFKESIPCRDLGTDLLCHIRNNTYIEYPQPDEHGKSLESLQATFWNKLASDLHA